METFSTNHLFHIILSLFFIMLNIPMGTGCKFEGLLSSCHVSVGGLEMEATALINHCHSPPDISISLSSVNNESALSWRYTYLPSNGPESHALPNVNPRILLHIMAKYESEKRLHIQSQFLLDGHTSDELTLWDQNIRLQRCEKRDVHSLHAALFLAFLIALGLVAASLLLASILVLWMRKGIFSARRSEDKQTLVQLSNKSNPFSSNLSSTSATGRQNELIDENEMRDLSERTSNKSTHEQGVVENSLMSTFKPDNTRINMKMSEEISKESMVSLGAVPKRSRRLASRETSVDSGVSSSHCSASSSDL